MPLFRTIRRILYVLLDLLLLLLVIRFALRFFGANLSAGFARFIDSITLPFVQPFLGLFPQSQFGLFSVEWGTLIAAVIYTIAAYAVVRLLQVIFVPNPHVAREVEDDMQE